MSLVRRIRGPVAAVACGALLALLWLGPQRARARTSESEPALVSLSPPLGAPPHLARAGHPAGGSPDESARLAGEQEAARALRQGSCDEARSAYADLALTFPEASYFLAAQALRARCAASQEISRPSQAHAAVPRGKARVRISVTSPSGETVEDARVEHRALGQLVSMHLLGMDDDLLMPRAGPARELELTCPAAMAPVEPLRRLPFSLPPETHVRFVCVPASVRVALVVILDSARQTELEVVAAGQRLGTTRGTVGHFVIDGPPREPVPITVRALDGGPVEDPVRHVVVDASSPLLLEVFELPVWKKPGRARRPEPERPYRLVGTGARAFTRR